MMPTQLHLFSPNIAPLQAEPRIVWRRHDPETGRTWWYEDHDEAQADRRWSETVEPVVVEEDDAEPDPPAD